MRTARDEAKTKRPHNSSSDASINHLNRAGYVGGIVTKEKRNKASDLFRPTDPVQRHDVARRIRHGSVDHVFDLSDHGSINDAPTRDFLSVEDKRTHRSLSDTTSRQPPQRDRKDH